MASLIARLDRNPNFEAAVVECRIGLRCYRYPLKVFLIPEKVRNFHTAELIAKQLLQYTAEKNAGMRSQLTAFLGRVITVSSMK